MHGFGLLPWAPPLVTDTATADGYSRVRLARHLLPRAIGEFAEDRCSQFAAAIAYHVLFSLFPLAIVLTAIFGLVVRTTGVQADVIDAITRSLPLSAAGTQDVRDLLQTTTGGLSTLGLFGFVGVLYSASGMMAAIRTAINAAFDVEDTRPFLKGKLVDLSLVGAAALAVTASLALTVTVRVLRTQARTTAGIDLSAGWVSVVVGVALPFVIACGIVFAVLRFVPAAEVASRHAAVVAAVVTALFVIAQNLFALYVSNFADYNAIYGSLGAIVAFMFFVYLSALLLLLGAEVTSEWPASERALRRGEVEEGPPVSVQARQLLRGLWTRERHEEAERERRRAEPRTDRS